MIGMRNRTQPTYRFNISKIAISLQQFLFLILIPPLCLAQQNINEADLLKSMPPEILKTLILSGKPNASGMIGRNKEGWLHVRLQCSVTFYLMIGSALNIQEYTDDAWRGIDAAFDQQTINGNFLSGTFESQTIPMKEDLSGTAFWLADLSHALLVVKESALEPLYRDRIANLLPKVKIALDWLALEKDTLKAYDADAPNRLFYDAEAFGLGGLLVQEDSFKVLGTDFLQQALALQRADGVFIENGGYDSSYQAVSLLHAMSYQIRFPQSALKQAIEKGTSWELSRVTLDGEVLTEGNTRTGSRQEDFLNDTKEVSYPTIVKALLYYSALKSDADVRKTAQNVFKFGMALLSPTIKNSYFNSNGNFEIQWPGLSTKAYKVEWSSNLVDWIVAETNIVGSTGTMSWSDKDLAAKPTNKLFYRVRVP
jgi:hypothetical protein